MRYMMRDKTVGLGPVIVTQDEYSDYMDSHPHNMVEAEAIMTAEQGRVESKTPDYYRLPMGMDVYDLLTREECIGFCKGNILKYVIRAGKKPGQDIVKELTKARDNIDKWLEVLEDD